jgi:LmbE family N-acetylglucosaminyl deacetylase
LAALGVAEHRFFDYLDGTLADQDTTTAIARVAAIIDDVQPDTIVTFGPDGLTGHADHRRISTWATVARELTAPDARLLYATTTAAHAERWRQLHDQFDVFLDPDLPLRTSPDQVALEIVLDGALADRKLVALRAQASQTAGLIAAMGEQVYRAWTSTETFREAMSMVPRAVPDGASVPRALLSR